MRRLPLPASRSGRALLGFWAAVTLVALGTFATLQWLGPPPHRRVSASMQGDGASPPAKPVASVRQPLPVPKPVPQPVVPAKPAMVAKPPAAETHRAIAPPDAALLEPSSQDPSAMLPRIGADGRQSWHVYAASAPDSAAGVNRVAILLDGVGLSEADSLDAIDRLPAAVSLAVSPYAQDPGAILDAARRAGHELLLSLPMEPADAPTDDEGSRALTQQVTSDENRLRLNWSLSRISGYAGVTNAFLGMGGERFASSPHFDEIIARLSRRGLLYLDATPGAAPLPGIANAVADLRIDDPPSAARIDAQLAALDRLARSKGSAIGVAGPIYPVTIDRLADWTHSLLARGLILVPVSSLVHIPHATATPGASSAAHAKGRP